MSRLDYVVLVGTLLGITLYGWWRTRVGGTLTRYLRGDERAGWGTIGLSVLATQASAITFLSLPGQAYESGVGFVQNYFGQPLALIVVCAFFVSAYQRLRVFTAYEYLGQRFDQKTRLLGAALFLIQRGLATGITIYAPAIVLSALLGWSLQGTILLSGAAVILYTTTGGARAVSLTQKGQLTVIFVGMCAALVTLVHRLPADVSVFQAVRLAGKMGKLEAVSFSFDPNQRYTVWSGLLGGFFLALSYFGADQTQVGRYLAGGSTTGSRLGLLFNALVKVPMQCFILFIGAMVFVFYQFEPPPVHFNRPAFEKAAVGHPRLTSLQEEYRTAFAERRQQVERLRETMLAHGDPDRGREDQAAALRAEARVGQIRDEVKREMTAAGIKGAAKDSDFVFLTFVLDHLPRGLIGLLVAVILCAAMGAASAGLNGLATTTMVDFYRPLLRPEATEAHLLVVSKLITAAWGVVAVGFALFANLVENLIEAGNILGSLFYGSILGLFLTAFFLPFVRGSAAFYGGLIAQATVLALYATTNIGYLWFNVIGCAGVMGISALWQTLASPRSGRPE